MNLLFTKKKKMIILYLNKTFIFRNNNRNEDKIKDNKN